jgi:hypothetical protein
VNRLIEILCLSFLIAWSPRADADLVKPLKEASTREELVKHFGTTIGFGHVEKWEFTTAGREFIMFWYCPYSGREECYVHGYYCDRAKQTWVLFVDRLIEPATRLYAEIVRDEHSLVLKDSAGKVVVRKSIASLPR